MTFPGTFPCHLTEKTQYGHRRPRDHALFFRCHRIGVFGSDFLDGLKDSQCLLFRFFNSFCCISGCGMRQRISEPAKGFDYIPNIIIGCRTDESLCELDSNL